MTAKGNQFKGQLSKDEKINFLLSALTHPSIVISQSGEVIGCNHAFCKTFELRFEDVLNSNFFKLPCSIPYESITEVEKKEISKTHHVVTKKKQANTTIQWTTSDIEHSHLNQKCFLITGVVIAANHNDVITNNIIDMIPNHYIFWKDKDLIYRGCNQAFVKELGFKSKNEIIGKTDFDLPTPKEQSEAFRADDKAVIETLKPKLDIEEEQTLQDGKTRTLSTSKAPLLDNEGQVIGVLAIYSDITQRKKLEDSLKIQKEKAEVANRAKSEFIANMSHDIRTPLSGIIGVSSILEDEAKDETIKEYAHMLNISGEQLLALLNSVLELAAAKSLEKKRLNLTTFSISEMLDNIFELELPSLKLKDIDFKLDIAKDVPDMVISDKEKIYRVVLNILSNAIKFTHNGHIKIKVERVKTEKKDFTLRFSVMDTGIGIPEKDISKVFDQFYRSTASHEGKFDGFGVGLHIVRDYIQSLNGKIDIQSKEGKGTTIALTIPVKKAKTSDTNKDQNKNISANKSAYNLADLKPGDADALVLLVEDNFIALKVATDVLTKAGCRVMQAETSKAALDLVYANRFDFILTDIGLPDFSGFELTERIHQYEKDNNLAPTPMIGLSAHAGAEDVKKGKKAGLIDLKAKPLKTGLVEKLIHQYGYAKKGQTTLSTDEPTVKDESKDIASGDMTDEQREYAKDLPQNEKDLFILDEFSLLDIEQGVSTTGDEDMLREMIKLMLDKTLEDDLTLLKNAHSDGDWDKTQKIAHKIKGGLVYLGANKLKMACQYLERYYKSGQRSHLEKLFEQVISVSEQTILEFRNYVAS